MPEPTRPGDHEGRQDRPQILDHRRADEPAHDRACPELVERRTELQGKDGACKEPGQDHDRERPDADAVELLDDVSRVKRPRHRGPERCRTQPDVFLNLQERRLQPVAYEEGHQPVTGPEPRQATSPSRS